jgi:CheY-like chemotaxis protein
MEGSPGPVHVDRAFFEQAIVNLVLNSRDAMPRGGDLVIGAAEMVFGGDLAAPIADMAPGSYVSVAVRDSGVGMDEATRARFFEPFFTTKEPGRGTGLGTSMVYGFVRQSGGRVTVESEPGAGTTVTIYLPRVEAAVAAPKQEGPQTASPGGSEVIIVVEDETAVRDLVVHVLREAGYDVVEARGAAEALAAAEGREGRIDLVITDIVMPGRNGADLAEELRALYPGILALFISGYPERLAAEGVRGEGTAFLAKPFAAQTLVRQVRDLLDSRGVP